MRSGVFADYKIFTGNSHPELAAEIAGIMGKPLGRATVTKFSDGEISVNIWESVRGLDIYIIQSTCNPVNDNLMELLIMIDAMKRASAGRINGSVTRARNMAEMLNCPIAIIDKRRPEPNKSEIMNIIGNIEGKNCIIIDDMIDTAGTISNAANAIKELGAKAVYAAATHPVLSGPAVERLEASAIEELVLLNTVPLPEEKKIEKMSFLSVAPLFAEAMTRVFTNGSISVLFD